MKLKKEHQYINLTWDEVPVSMGKIYADRGHGGLTVRVIDNYLNGYTKVEYIKNDGSFGWYDAITYDLEEPDPLERMIFYELFNSGLTGEVKYLCDGLGIDRDNFFTSFMGYFNMGDPVWDHRWNGIHGYVVSTNGIDLHPKGGNENGKIEIEYVDQSGNISRFCSMSRGVISLGPANSEILRKGLENFGYVFDKNCMRIKKSGDLVLPIKDSSMEWKIGDNVYHPTTGRSGSIELVSLGSAEVDFGDYLGIVDLKDLKYIEDYGS